MSAATPIDTAPTHVGHRHHHQPPPPPIRQRDRVLLTIAAFKFVKAVLFVVVALGAFGLLRRSVADRAQDWVATLAATYDRGLTHRVVELLQRISALSRHRLEAVGVAALLYAGLFVTEGVGLWRGRRWAEWLTVVATTSLVPLEIYELSRRLTPPRFAALFVNLVVVTYLLVQLRRKHYR
jgi:uncharacterized membrane protein (DUF2068 family)